jgi:proteasome lid subunit RPN8/RPN11
VLYLTAHHLQQITAHARQTYPEECCGLLIGSRHPDKRLVEVRSLLNAWNAEAEATLAALIPPGSGKTDRYWIDPRDLLTAQREARDRQLDLIGVYHSHPNHAAIPSESDRLIAWAEYSYLIVSVRPQQATECCCWVLDDQHQFQPEEILIVEATPPAVGSS